MCSSCLGSSTQLFHVVCHDDYRAHKARSSTVHSSYCEGGVDGLENRQVLQSGIEVEAVRERPRAGSDRLHAGLGSETRVGKTMLC